MKTSQGAELARLLHRARPPGNELFTNTIHHFVGWYLVMRKVVVAGSLAVLLGGSATYALLGPRAVAPVETKVAAVEEPKLETARLFASPRDVSPAPASDLIATKLATQQVIWPDAPKAAPVKPAPKVAKTANAKPAKKPKQVKKPKEKKQAASSATGAI